MVTRVSLVLPPVVAQVLPLLSRAWAEVRLLATLSPVEGAAERARLTARLRAGQAVAPAWQYAPVSHEALRRALDEACRRLDPEASDPLVAATRDRALELRLEAELCAAAGTPAVAALAQRRFAPVEAADAPLASALAASWLAASLPDDPGPWLASDALDPRSLLSRMREAVGRARLPFAVVVEPSLAPLAATGDGVILVASGRPTTEADVARTVLHEVQGHAAPRARARLSSLPLLRIGTARGVDEQEGLALVLEERHGHLSPRRQRGLAARHRAVEAMLDGARFPDVTTLLVRDLGVEPEAAVLVAERVFRGGDGVGPGLGRERVYLEAFVRVRAHVGAHPGDEAVLSAGQVAVAAVPAVAAFAAPSAAPEGTLRGSTRSGSSPCRRPA